MLVTTWAMMRLRQRRRRADMQPTASEQIDRNRQARGLRGDLEQVMVEVEQLAKRFSAQLDAKSMRLEKLIDEADQRLAKLESLQPPEVSPPAEVSPKVSEPPVEAVEADALPTSQVAAPDDENELAASVYRLADAGNDAIEIARALGEHVGKVELILALRQ